MTAEQPGYGFAAFRSHALFHGNGDDWYVPGVTAHTISQEGWGNCGCGEGYRVHNDYHYHDLDGKCHNKARCI